MDSNNTTCSPYQLQDQQCFSTKYPALPDHIPVTINEALGSFLHANVAHHVKNMLNDVDAKDGMGILLRIQEIYAPASTKDRNEALAYLNDLQMHPKDTITNFIQKFQRALKTLADVSIGTPAPDPSHTINLFIQKCLRTVPEGSDLGQTLLFYQRIMCHHTPGTPMPFTMSKMEADLCQHENTL